MARTNYLCWALVLALSVAGGPSLARVSSANAGKDSSGNTPAQIRPQGYAASNSTDATSGHPVPQQQMRSVTAPPAEKERQFDSLSSPATLASPATGTTQSKKRAESNAWAPSTASRTSATTRPVRLDLSGLSDTGGRQFEPSRLHRRAALVFLSTAATAAQCRHWGEAIAKSLGAQVAPWDQAADQRVVVVPVINLSELPRFVPTGMVPSIVRWMRKGNDVLLDWDGRLSKAIGQPRDQAAVALISGDGKIQTIAFGDYDRAAGLHLLKAISRDLTPQTTLTLKPRPPATVAKSRSAIIR